MKSRRTWWILACSLIFAVGAQAALDRGAKPILVCGEVLKQWGMTANENCFSTCGGEIPWPFQASNQVVELAHEEKYVLMGRVEFRDGLPRFFVDLQEHSWLATNQRKADPSYRLLGTIDYWRAFESKRIQLRAVARWLPSGSTQGPVVEVALDSLVEPAVVSSTGPSS